MIYLSEKFERLRRIRLVLGDTRNTYFGSLCHHEILLFLRRVVDQHYDTGNGLLGRLVSLINNVFDVFLLCPCDSGGVLQNLKIGLRFLFLLSLPSFLFAFFNLHLFALFLSLFLFRFSFHVHITVLLRLVCFLLLSDRECRSLQDFLLLLLFLARFGVGKHRRGCIGLDGPILRHLEVFVQTDDCGRGEGETQEVNQRVPVPELWEQRHSDDGGHLLMTVLGQQGDGDVAPTGIQNASRYYRAKLSHRVPLRPKRFVDFFPETLHTRFLLLVVLDKDHGSSDESRLPDEFLGIVEQGLQQVKGFFHPTSGTRNPHRHGGSIPNVRIEAFSQEGDDRGNLCRLVA
mmetsp:Transcript_3584/g.7235  ORF Transcript_3584/g.7235 Transcript_3584/m.7235 type:complete len:345 (-) Transcript_3584:622-1656(-)